MNYDGIDYETAARYLAGLPKPPIDANATITVQPSGLVIPIRDILNWVATDEGRKNLAPDVRTILLEFAARVV
jgi:hypothetical protein